MKRSVLLSVAFAALLAHAERTLTISAYSERVKAHVVEKIAEALTNDFAVADVSGVVTFVDSDSLFIQRDDDGLKIAVDPSQTRVRPGDAVTISGSPFFEGGRVVIRARSVTKNGTEPLPPPRAIVHDQLVDAGDGGVNALRVSLAGRAIGITESGFAIDVGGVPVNVMCADLPAFLDDAAATHPKVIVSGVIEQLLDQSALFGRKSFVMGVKLNAVGADVKLVPDLAYYAAKRNRRFVLIAWTVSLVLALVLIALGAFSFRQRRRLFRTRTIMAERKRMADDIHDTIEQHLVGAGMLIKLGRFKEAEGVLVRAKREIRDIVWGLKNDDMMRLSPAEMLRKLAHDENTKGICRVDTKLSALPASMNAAQMRDLSLIVREAIGNAVKHGGASKVAITADHDEGGGWMLRIANNGAPFDPEHAPGAAEGHFGLEGMRQRAARIGTSISFSRRGDWMVVTLEGK